MLASVNENVVSRAIATLALALLGGALLTWVGLPAGWLAGAMLFVAIAALSGLESEVPDKIRWIFFLYLGIFAGSGASPATLEQIALWPASFAMLLVTVAGIISTSYILLRRLFHWDGQTAFFAGKDGRIWRSEIEIGLSEVETHNRLFSQPPPLVSRNPPPHSLYRF